MAQLTRSQRLKIDAGFNDLTEAIIQFHNENSGTLPTADDAALWGGTTLDDLNGEISTAIHKHVTTGHGAHPILTADQLDGVSIEDLNNGFMKGVNFYNIPVNYCSFIRDGRNKSGKDIYVYKDEDERTDSTGIIIYGVLTVAVGGKQAVFDNYRMAWPEGIRDFSDQGYLAAERDDNDNITLRLLSSRLNTIKTNPETTRRMYVGVWEKTNTNHLWEASNANVDGHVSNNMFTSSYLNLQAPGNKTTMLATGTTLVQRYPWQRAHL